MRADRLLSSVLLSIAAAMHVPPAAAADDAAAVRAVGERWRAYYESGQFEAIPDLYTEDTLVMPRGRPAIVGREAMRRAIGGAPARREADIALQGGGSGGARGDPRDVGAFTEYARSLVIFQRGEDGEWRVHRDIDARAPPAAAAAGPAAAPAATAPLEAPAVWDPASRREATDCDRMASSRYDRTRLADAKARAEIDVPATIAQCERDLERLPNDPRILFHLGRLYGYTGDARTTRMYRQRAADAGNHNAIFLLGYLDWLAAQDDGARCTAASRMRLAADRGNYSAQLTYATLFLEGRLAACADTPPRAQLLGYVRNARPAADGFFETLLADHLQHELR